MRTIAFVVALVSTAIPARAQATVDLGLQRAMSSGGTTSAFVVLRDQIDVPAMVDRLDAMRATRAFRHRLVIESLQDLAKRCQPPVVSDIQDLQRSGDVVDWTPFWVFNGFGVRGTPQAFARLAARSDVAELRWAGPETTEGTDRVGFLASNMMPAPGGPSPGLLQCHADQLWLRGYTGQSVLVANIDTGVDVTHPALASRWRGALPGVPLGAAWFDPTGKTSYPVDPLAHGTATMSVLCGWDGGANVIGMAPQATWIASNAIDASGTQAQQDIWYTQALQWCADPDGNPATIDDVPDVCNNSWGLLQPGVCATTFNSAIDAAEAATVILVWAVGNEALLGPREPATRATSSSNTFSVGALDTSGQMVAPFSSIGPSPCDPTEIKPELAAPGVLVRAAYPGGSYYDQTGTSMACPHVAGGAALLRDVWPEITVPMAKQILMQTAVDLGPPGEDNWFGAGRLDMDAAYKRLIQVRPQVDLAVMGTRSMVPPGGTTVAHIALSSWSSAPETVVVAIDILLDGQPTGLFLVRPTTFTVSPMWSNAGSPVQLPIAVPANLPASQLGKEISIRGTLWQNGRQTVQASYDFTVG